MITNWDIIRTMDSKTVAKFFVSDRFVDVDMGHYAKAFEEKGIAEPQDIIEGWEVWLNSEAERDMYEGYVSKELLDKIKKGDSSLWKKNN